MKTLKVKLGSSYAIRISDIAKKELLLLRKEFTKKNPEYFKLRALGYSTHGVKPHINLYQQQGEYIHLPRGDLDKLELLLGNYKLAINDMRFSNPLGKAIRFKEGFKLWTSQEEARDIAVAEEQGLIHGVCGSGKTEILLSIFAELSEKTLVVVDKLELMNQWRKRAKKRFANVDVAIIGGGEWGIGDITIGSQRTLIKHVDKIKNEFGVILCDEVHHYAAPTFQSLISEIPAKYRIGATATLKRKDQKQFLVYSAFGRVLYEITDEDLKKEGKIFEVELIVVPTDFRSEDYVQLEEDRVSGETEVSDYNYHALLAEMKVSKERNKLILRLIKMEVKNSHKCLIMADRISHCIYIKRMLEKENIKVGLMVGEKEFQKERQEAQAKLLAGKISCIVVSPLVQEGFDLPELDRGFIINPSASNSAKLQQQGGRVKRIAKGKKSAKVYYFWDRFVYGFKSHLEKIKRVYNNTKIYVKR